MRVTLVCPFDPRPAGERDDGAHVGGVERVYAHLAALLARRGHRVTLLCSSREPTEDREEDGIIVRRVRRRFTIFRTPVARLHAHIPKDTDVVQVVATYPFVTIPALKAAWRLGAATLVDFHFEPHPPGWMAGLAARLHARRVRPTFAHADAVLVRSLDYARRAESLQDVPVERFRILPNGVDPDQFKPASAQTSGAYMLFVGRLVPYKGLDVLLRAMASTQAPLPLKVAGVGPLGPRLKDRARRLGLPVDFLGRVPDSALPDLYRGARFTVLPSINRQEAFGMVLLESMACGTPVVASRLPGVAEVAAHGGILAEPGDPDSLAQALEYASQPGALPRGPRVAEPIRERYAWASVATNLEEVYDDLVRRRPAPADGAGVRPDADPGRTSLLRA